MHFTLVAFTPTRTRTRSHTHAHTCICVAVFMYHIYQCILFGGCCRFALPLAVLNAFPMICWQITFSCRCRCCSLCPLSRLALAFMLLFRPLFAQSRAQNFPNSFPKQTCIRVKRLSLRSHASMCVGVCACACGKCCQPI